MEPLTIFIIVGIIAAAAIVGGTVSINTGLININFKKSRDTYSALSHIAQEYTRKITMAENNILKNQMIFAESAINEINNHIQNNGADLDKYHKSFVYGILKNIVKTHFMTNGFDSMDPGQFSKYVGNRIDLLRDKYKELVPSEYLDTHDFSEKVAEIYHHALACNVHWKEQISNLKRERDRKIDELIKGK
jgi:hypothetical protein